MKKKYFFKGITFYSLLAMFAVLILVVVCSAYLICYFALREASGQLETSLETVLTLQVETIGENYSSDVYSDLEAELAANEILAELASREQITCDENVSAAENLLLDYKESITYADLICYFYFEKSGYLMGTMLSGEDASDLAPDYVTEQLERFSSMEIGASEKYLGVDGDGTYYDVCLIRLTSGLGLIRVSLGSPSYKLPELFLSNMVGVEMYTYDRYGNEHALEESQELAGVYDYDSLGEADSDTFTFSSNGHSYIGSYYTFASRPIRLAVFCRDTATEYRVLSLRIVLIVVLCVALAGLGLAILFARWTGQLREKERMLDDRSRLEPDSAQLRALSSAIASLSVDDALEQYDALTDQLTELCGNTPDNENMIFYLVEDTIALSVLDLSVPGDISRQMVRGYAQTIRQAQNAAELRNALLSVLDALENDTEDEKESGRKRFERIRQYLQENFRDPNLSAGMVSEQFHVSPSGLSRQFKKYNKTGFLEYLHQLRVAEAVRLLQETDHTIAEVAELCGYTNVYTMNRAFKTYANTTPGKIRDAAHRRNRPE